MKIGLEIDGIISYIPKYHRLLIHTKGKEYLKKIQNNTVPNGQIVKLINILIELEHQIFFITGRNGVKAYARTMNWFSAHCSNWLIDNNSLFVNYENTDIADLMGEIYHKEKYINKLDLDIYIESNESVAELLRQKTDAIIIYYCKN